MDEKYKQVFLRLIYSICYTLLEIVRREPAPSDPEQWWRLHKNFKDELAEHPEYISELMDLLVEGTPGGKHHNLYIGTQYMFSFYTGLFINPNESIIDISNVSHLQLSPQVSNHI